MFRFFNLEIDGNVDFLHHRKNDVPAAVFIAAMNLQGQTAVGTFS